MSASHLAIICENAAGSGSVARVALRHAIELARFFSVSFLSDTLPSRFTSGVKYFQINAPRFDFLRRYCHVPNQLAFAIWARRVLENTHLEHPIQGIICHSHATAALAAKPFGISKCIPYALVTHGDIFDVPAGSYDSRLTRFYKAVHPPAYRGASLIVALSPHMANCAKAGGADAAKVRILPNGFDPADIGVHATAPMQPLTAAGDGVLRLLFVGRLAKEKGVDVLLHAARLLIVQGVKFRLRIIGDGIESDLHRSNALSLGLGAHVTFAGAIPGRDMGREYHAADLVCVPSISDPLPSVVLEAMGMGRPVIGSDVGGIPFMISDQDTGMLVQPGSATALAHGIATLASNQALLRRMGKRAALSAQARFSWPKISAELAALIEETMGLARIVEPSTTIS